MKAGVRGWVLLAATLLALHPTQGAGDSLEPTNMAQAYVPCIFPFAAPAANGRHVTGV
jgi:hypothetical protein